MALFAAAIFAASSLPKITPVAPALPGLDKVLHFAVYFLFAATVRWALLAHNISPGAAAVAAALAAAAYGATDEFHQAFVAGRNATVGDWLADFAGAAALAAAVLLRARRANPQRRPRAP